MTIEVQERRQLALDFDAGMSKRYTIDATQALADVPEVRNLINLIERSRAGA